jgi:hypothetical protein
MGHPSRPVSVVAPGLVLIFLRLPSAYALGCIMPPLCGCDHKAQGMGAPGGKVPTSGKIGLGTTHSKIAKSAILEWGTLGKGTVMALGIALEPSLQNWNFNAN